MKIGHGEKRSRKEEQAIGALLSEPTIAEAAKKIKIGEVTLWRWLQDPDFQEKYRTARRQAVSHAITQLQKITSDAVQVLQNIMNDANSPTASRIAAVKIILDTAIRGLEMEDLSARVEVLEKTAQPHKIRV